MKTGEYLVKEGVVTDVQVQEALDIQKKNPEKKIGEILLELNYIDIEKFTQIIDRQLKNEGLMK